MTRRDRLRELDLLRFVAALSVVLFHFTGFNGPGPWPHPSRELFPAMAHLTRYGYLGVDLFFMISGFVILMSAWGRSPGEFVVSRLVRLMPAYWVGVLLGATLYATAKLGNGAPGLIIPNLTMLQGGLGVENVDAVFWTLWVELHFYVLIAFLSVFGITYRNCLVFMTAWMFFGVFADEADSKFLKIMLVPTWSPYFIAGMALFLIYRFGPTLLLWGYVVVGWLLALFWGAWRTEAAFKGANENVVGVAVTLIFIVMILVATGKLRWLRWRGLTVLGALTYPLYLTHSQIALPVLDAAYPGMNRWAALALVIGVSMLTAYAVYRLVEKPGQKWFKDQLRKSLAPLRPPAPEPAVPAVPAPRRVEPEPVPFTPTGPAERV
ncbi:acyltransferase [Actinomadura barringtoniae]|uniref:Acyltransferase n=1 Tax=Actinomadura barringtoniae TaxID=1427535 RepID=A0A939PDY3_9ACTN|nr:acyltransferase [Actinomadura barringtoniae]MBO2450467.1 acyltransferase [Actinomadura barringtoniae]